METGESAALTATISPKDATNQSITWSSSNTKVATVSDGKVTALSAGNTTITAKCGSKTAACTVAVKSKPIRYSGSGDDVITGVSVPAGIYRVIMTNSGTEHFSVVTYDSNGKYNDLLANDSGAPYAGEAIFREGSISATTNWSFEISSKSNWSIEISEVTDKATTNIRGTGSKVTGLISGDSFSAVSMTNSGREHFSVIIYNSTGKYEALLANDSGSPYSGKKTFNLKKGNEYFLVVDSESDWTIDFGLGDTLTTYGLPTSLKPSSEDGNSSNPSGDAVSWSRYYSGTKVPTFESVIAYYGTHTPGNGSVTHGNADTYKYEGALGTDVDLYERALQQAFGFVPDKSIDGFYESADKSCCVMVSFISTDFRSLLIITVDSYGQNHQLP